MKKILFFSLLSISIYSQANTPDFEQVLINGGAIDKDFNVIDQKKFETFFLAAQEGLNHMLQSDTESEMLYEEGTMMSPTQTTFVLSVQSSSSPVETQSEMEQNLIEKSSLIFNVFCSTFKQNSFFNSKTLRKMDYPIHVKYIDTINKKVAQEFTFNNESCFMH
ncbi:hypothetical protein [Acinetobacter stercoris]|uniref:Uncharacterized protein n=1 Tax=Acinetobacter stercoris TaxID=2126983 RepID=A0A2U3MY11_9GAMM|nr:hypothetical protein [Acinetobacter stercoris]SPL70317.1 hypothetical protein KPC_1495 [Acinetobacter stercoris]